MDISRSPWSVEKILWYYYGILRWAGVPVPRLIPSRQKLTVDQQVRLCSHIGFTGDKGPSRALIREA